MSATAAPHRILLTHGRELRFDHDGSRFRVAYYVPDADRDLLRQLAAKANRGDLAAAERLHSLPRTRTVGADNDLRYAIEEAVVQQDERRARKIACELADYAAGMGWT